MHRIYIAGPLFNTHERWYLERIAEAIEGAGYATFLPHRDAGLVDLRDPQSQVKVFRDDITALDSCDICVALLTGSDQDSGTSAELGYMFAHGRICFGITDDFRRAYAVKAVRAAAMTRRACRRSPSSRATN